MTDYVIALIYINLGYIGASCHWVKKRYVDNTTVCSFIEYLKGEKKATIKAVLAIFSTEIALSLAHTGGYHIPLGELVGAITAGYACDSGLNKAPDA